MCLECVWNFDGGSFCLKGHLEDRKRNNMEVGLREMDYDGDRLIEVAEDRV
jgi:hypothetical protein